MNKNTGSAPKTYTSKGDQGDVRFTRVAELPTGVKPAKPEGIRDGKPAYIAAHSETGHHHLVDATAAVMYETTTPGVAYLQLAEAAADVVHMRHGDAHGTVSLLGGAGAVWKVSRQRESLAMLERAVAD